MSSDYNWYWITPDCSIEAGSRELVVDYPVGGADTIAVHYAYYAQAEAGGEEDALYCTLAAADAENPEYLYGSIVNRGAAGETVYYSYGEFVSALASDSEGALRLNANGTISVYVDGPEEGEVKSVRFSVWLNDEGNTSGNLIDVREGGGEWIYVRALIESGDLVLFSGHDDDLFGEPSLRLSWPLTANESHFLSVEITWDDDGSYVVNALLDSDSRTTGAVTSPSGVPNPQPTRFDVNLWALAQRVTYDELRFGWEVTE